MKPPSAPPPVLRRVIVTILTLKGVYVPADPQFPKHFHGIGMRIEDEVVVGAEHPIVLSANAPKEVCRPASSPHRISSLADCCVDRSKM